VRPDPICPEALNIIRQSVNGGVSPPAPESRGKDAGALLTRRLSDIEPKPISWLWPGRIARGKLTIIAGNPGLGKSSITASIAAIVTTGGCWPVDGERCRHGDVLFLTAEDDPADTLRPRLDAAGADVTRVSIIDGTRVGYTGEGEERSRIFSLQEDLRALSNKLAELLKVSAVIIDPISAYLGNTDSHNNAEVRGLLTPLSELAARHDVAIIAVSHLNKSTAGSAEAMMRISGSLAFVAAARAAYLVAPDPDDKARRLFLPMKNNLGPDVTGLAYRIEAATIQSKAGTLHTSRIAWDTTAVSVTADEIMQPGATEKVSAVDEVAEWLRGVLAYGPKPSNDIFEQADAEGFTERTVKRAKKKLGIETAKSGMGGGWRWQLPKGAKSSEECQERNLAPFEELGTLQEPDGGTAEVEL
jgi:putative DNA primase/helicase